MEEESKVQYVLSDNSSHFDKLKKGKIRNTGNGTSLVLYLMLLYIISSNRSLEKRKKNKSSSTM